MHLCAVLIGIILGELLAYSNEKKANIPRDHFRDEKNHCIPKYALPKYFEWEHGDAETVLRISGIDVIPWTYHFN